MGLDITAYSNLNYIGGHHKDPNLNQGEEGGPDDHCCYDNHITAFAYKGFEDSLRGVPNLHVVESRWSTLTMGGCYETTDRTATHDFHAGPYSFYGMWRRDLARQFNPNAGKNNGADLPFYELIWFADNEGTIGPEAAADLLADFREHANQYAPQGGDPGLRDWCRELYADWTRAFELAAQGGLVAFH